MSLLKSGLFGSGETFFTLREPTPPIFNKNRLELALNDGHR